MSRRAGLSTAGPVVEEQVSTVRCTNVSHLRLSRGWSKLGKKQCGRIAGVLLKGQTRPARNEERCGQVSTVFAYNGQYV